MIVGSNLKFALTMFRYVSSKLFSLVFPKMLNVSKTCFMSGFTPPRTDITDKLLKDALNRTHPVIVYHVVSAPFIVIDGQGNKKGR